MDRPGQARLNLAAGPPPLPVPGPHAFTTPDLVAVLKALVAAWDQLPYARVGPRPFCRTDYEDEDLVTHHLLEILCDMHSSYRLPFFTPDRFDQPTRDAKFPNHDRRRIDLMPDIVFRTRTGAPHGSGRRFGLFAECKVIGVRRKQISPYVRNGIRKFLDGDYAWAMRQGLMIGYVLAGQTLPGSLDAYVGSRCAGRRDRRYRPKGGLKSMGWAAIHPELAEVHVGVHPRRFTVDGAPAGDIEIAHLWLRRP